MISMYFILCNYFSLYFHRNPLYKGSTGLSNFTIYLSSTSLPFRSTFYNTRKIKQLNLGIIIMYYSRDAGESCELIRCSFWMSSSKCCKKCRLTDTAGIEKVNSQLSSFNLPTQRQIFCFGIVHQQRKWKNNHLLLTFRANGCTMSVKNGQKKIYEIRIFWYGKSFVFFYYFHRLFLSTF